MSSRASVREDSTFFDILAIDTFLTSAGARVRLDTAAPHRLFIFSLICAL